MDFYSVNIDFEGHDLSVNQGTLEYLADINPAVEWNRRGFKATGYHKSEIMDFQKKIIEKIKNRLDPEDSKAMDDFLPEVLTVFKQIMNRNFEPVRERLGDTNIFFITGPPRTGGTYLLRSLVELLDDQLENYNHKLVSDHVPSGTQVRPEFGSEKTNQMMFEWSQWFIWATRKFDVGKVRYIPKKHIGMIFQLKLFEDILGDHANFIITTRHPGEAFQSYVERFLPKDSDAREEVDVGLWKAAVLPRTNVDEDRWEELSLEDQFLLYWCACYLEVINYGNEDRLKILKFGKEYSQFLQQFARENERIYLPEEFDPTPREDLPDFSESCLKMKDKVESLWEEKFGKKLY